MAVGDWEFYFEDGQVLAYGSYQWGKEDGTWRHYHKNGELSKIYHYESDQYSEKKFENTGESTMTITVSWFQLSIRNMEIY